MKFSAALALIVFVGLVANSAALPAKKRMVFLSQQQPQWYGAPQRLMYVQASSAQSRTHARSTQAAALVSGDSVATGTYLNDCNHAEGDATQQQSEDALGAADAAVESVAEVDGTAVELEVENTDAKVPRDLNLDAEVEVPVEEPAVDIAAELPAPAPIVPARRYLPVNKKVLVELDPTAESDDDEVHDDEEDEDEVIAAPVSPPRRPAKKAGQNAGAKPSKAPLPAGSFFPINFGGTDGGAIAIANSFSTGEGGSATSHAIAYGSPDSTRSRNKNH